MEGETQEALSEFAPEERARREAILEERSARAHAGEEQLIDNEEAKRRLRLRSAR